ncbi:MAG TPA: XdhC/CoxI family protein, partial [Chloroflexota bacterium]|nr:XdhC/CoxI family protein [Chloroflexota bacterium]
SLFDRLRRYIREERAVCLATIISGPAHVGAKMIVHRDGSVEGGFADVCLQAPAAAQAVELLSTGETDSRVLETPEGVFEVFYDSYPIPPTIVIVGAVQTAQSLTRLAKELGYTVVVTDARATFATAERFPQADRVLKGWPQDVLPGLRMDESTYLVLLSHDPKFDEPTLHLALPRPLGYIGAIGSRRTQQQRRERLLEQGFDAEAVGRIHGPVGLDLGGKSPEETALSILAEITAVRHGRTGGMMSQREREASLSGSS